VAAAPDDDGPRLVLADWLLQQGEPEGELISLAVAQARLPARSPAWRALDERRRTLAVPEPPLPDLKATWGMTRGIWESVSIAFPALLEHAEMLFTAAPVLRDVEVKGLGEEEVGVLVAQPWFPRLRRLRLTWHTATGALLALGRSPRVSALRALQVSWAAIAVPGFAALGHSPHLTGLQTLDLGLSGLGDEGLQAVLAPGMLPSVNELILSNNQVGTAGCEAIAAHAPPVEKLQLGWNKQGFKGVRALAGSPRLRSLRHLDLDHSMPGDKGCAALAASGIALETLDLRRARVGPEGARALAASPLADTLVYLDVRENSLDDSTRGLLRERFGERVEV
jgi:uncharacterized protein (TIGR02996 family)